LPTYPEKVRISAAALHWTKCAAFNVVIVVLVL